MKAIKNPWCESEKAKGHPVCEASTVASYQTLTDLPPERVAELPAIPDGWEFDPPIRVPKQGEHILGADSVRRIANMGHDVCCIIIIPKRWRAKKGEYYWTIRYGWVVSIYEANARDDNDTWNSGWYWRTSEEAQAALDRMNKAREKLVL